MRLRAVGAIINSVLVCAISIEIQTTSQRIAFCISNGPADCGRCADIHTGWSCHQGIDSWCRINHDGDSVGIHRPITVCNF